MRVCEGGGRVFPGAVGRRRRERHEAGGVTALATTRPQPHEEKGAGPVCR